MGNHQEASSNLNEGLLLSRELEDLWLQAIALGFLGATARDMHNEADAHRYFKNAIAVCRNMGDPHITLLIGILFSSMAQAMGSVTEARDLLHEGLQIARETGDRWGMGLGLEQIAMLMDADGDPIEARRLLEESVALHREIGDLWSLSRSLNSLSRLALTQFDITAAERHAVEAIKAAVESGYLSNALDSLTTLSTIHAQRGKDASALKMTLFILKHPSSTQDAKERAARLRLELESRLTPDEVQAIWSQTSPDTFSAFISL